MHTEHLVKTFVEYFEERDHRRIVGSALLPPPGDPVLFTTSGMHPLTPYLEGRPIRWESGWSTCSAVCAPRTWRRSATPLT